MKLGTRLGRGLTALLFLAVAVTAQAQSVEDGVAAYERGDYATALKIWKPFVEQGDAAAQYNLGLMYDFGRGVAEDDGEAVKWYRRAAEQGYASAQLGLGVMYDHGRGVVQDYVLAHMWLDLAVARSRPGEQRLIWAEYRRRIALNMTPAQVAEAQRLAREWKPKRPF